MVSRAGGRRHPSSPSAARRPAPAPRSNPPAALAPRPPAAPAAHGTAACLHRTKHFGDKILKFPYTKNVKNQYHMLPQFTAPMTAWYGSASFTTLYI